MAKPREGAEAAVASLDAPSTPSGPAGGEPAAARFPALPFERPQPALEPTDTFVRRHLGPQEGEVGEMLHALGLASLEELVRETVPPAIRLGRPLSLAGLPGDRELGEREVLAVLGGLAARNQVFKSYLGMGYHDCIVPGVIQRNILENPG